MQVVRTSRFASAQVSSRLRWLPLLLWMLPFLGSAATPSAMPQAAEPDSVVVTSATEVADTLANALAPQKKKRPRFLQGAAVGGDLLGLALKGMGSDWRWMEAFLRLNFRDEYFPIVEVGIGEADHEGTEIENRFNTRAPYFRLGLDYNFANQKHSGNRVLGGVRYGFSTYNYDYTAPGLIEDPVWKGAERCAVTDLSGHLHWFELVVGVETRLWSIIHLGWDLRAKLRIAQKAPDEGEPWYFPGFGKNTEGLVWGGSFKLVFDI